MPASMPWSKDLEIEVKPLTPVGFAAFGTVIQNPSKASFPEPPTSVEANQGSATKYSDVSPLLSSYSLGNSVKAASPKFSLFSCKPRRLQATAKGGQAFKVGILERHPFTPQTFIPTGLAADDRETAYLVIVAPTLDRHLADVNVPQYEVPGSTSQAILASNSIAARTAQPKTSGPPDLANLKAFVARGHQAVTYGAGTWHAPMVVLGKQTIDFVVVQYANGVAEEDCQEVEIHGSSIDVLIPDGLLKRSGAKL